ncbi:26S proteasome regulatory subunit [Toxoplasma gondii FOU]|uniref:26S proteasome regulatory subunit n=1 Tax=Toxoplasma gondii FOU TaxID=943167 RepID=A0A086L686_TOXGO|nr:26S proteasome regulatory subunit [Toxoplasma gondii FOU]
MEAQFLALSLRKSFSAANFPLFSDYEAICKLCDGFNGADLRNVCTEAGMFAIRAERDYVVEEDFFKAARKLADNKKLESTIDYDF